jgi:Carboxypeptidase regulatory-like domain
VNLNLRALRFLGSGFFVCLLALPLAATPASSKISGIVVDPGGTPQMGATVVVSPEDLSALAPIQVLTNGRGHFATDSLPAGLYSIQVTLAGFLPAIERHIQVDSQHATLLQVVLGSVFTSLSDLRKQPNQPASAADDWSWVLRSSPSMRPVLRWQDDPQISASSAGDTDQASSPRTRVEVSSGADHPGSISNPASAPGTSVAYNLDLGSSGRLLMAGQISGQDGSGSEGLAGEWLSTSPTGASPVTTFLVREAQLGPGGPSFRGLRMSHDSGLVLTDRVSIRYGGEYLIAGFNGTTMTVRPSGEITIQLSPSWQVDLIGSMRPSQDSASSGEVQTAMATLDAFPTLMMREGRPVFEKDMHEEVAFQRAMGARADLTAAVFHDRSSQTAVIGRGGANSPDFLQDYFSAAFAYDGGASESTGVRVAYREKLSDNVSLTLVYAYAGALSPNGETGQALRDELSTQYRHSAAARITTTVPRLGTKLICGYKWIDGTAVSHQDPYGESLYHLDPYVNLEIRQPLPSVFPGHMEVEANVGNLLAQGYTPLATSDGSVVLVPSYRYFRGGLSLQF